MIPFLPIQAQERRLRLVEWNVENLFDTIHDVGHDDRDFLPDGIYGWNSGRYFKKLSLVARTLAALGGTIPADLIALCEVENDSVLTQLTRRTLLARLGYEYVMTHGVDVRGIDVALLYQPLFFRPFQTKALRVPFDSLSERPTRDVLFVSGEIPTGDTLHVFVCHFPSRRGGKSASEPYRLRAAHVIRRVVDSLFVTSSDARIIVTGDFNDEPKDASIAQVLRAVEPTEGRDFLPDSTLFVLTSHLETDEGICGTYKYRGRWNRLDNILVSTVLLQPAKGLHTAEKHCAIRVFPHLIEPDGDRGEMKVKHTFLGPSWHGGASDHLPLILDLFY